MTPRLVPDRPELTESGAIRSTVWEQALSELAASVFHQGDLYTAAIPMAPFLVRVLRDGEPIDRAEALRMLTFIVVTDRGLCEADGFDPRQHALPAAYEAAADVGAYLALIDTTQPRDIQMAAADVLHWFPPTGRVSAGYCATDLMCLAVTT